MNTRSFRFSLYMLICGVVYAVGFLVGTSLNAQDTTQVGNLDSTAERVVDNGLSYFRRRLDAGIMPGDGAFRQDVAITALVGMAFLSSGSTPEEGPDARYVRLCLNWILKNVRTNGILASPNASEQGAVYAHGFAVTFLAECLGMSSDDVRIRSVLEKGVTRIVEAQGENGGWRYTFHPGEEDVSVTACMLTALRACRNAGISVPAETIKKGISYVLRCQNPDGGFRYRLVNGASAYPRTAAAIAGLCAAGTYNSPEIERALEYLKNATHDTVGGSLGETQGDTQHNISEKSVGKSGVPTENSETDGYFYYAQYYAVQAFRLTETQHEENALPMRTLMRQLERLQKPDGSWRSSLSVDYATAMALIAFQAETNYLPILQK